LRLFAALELPGEVVAALEGWARACERPGLRILPPASLHVTLAFLGERPDAEAGAIGDAVLACTQPVGGLRIGEPVWLGRGGALAADLGDEEGACTRLQARVAAALAALGAYAPEQRPFRPHVTVARVRRGARVARQVPDPPALGPFAGTALTLFASRLSPRGASYSPVVRADLPR
jgi:RNA 2',3'-cyclic 3'-phosphodiesterase